MKNVIILRRGTKRMALVKDKITSFFETVNGIGVTLEGNPTPVFFTEAETYDDFLDEDELF